MFWSYIKIREEGKEMISGQCVRTSWISWRRADLFLVALLTSLNMSFHASFVLHWHCLPATVHGGYAVIGRDSCLFFIKACKTKKWFFWTFPPSTLLYETNGFSESIIHTCLGFLTWLLTFAPCSSQLLLCFWYSFLGWAVSHLLNCTKHKLRTVTKV